MERSGKLEASGSSDLSFALLLGTSLTFLDIGNLALKDLLTFWT